MKLYEVRTTLLIAADEEEEARGLAIDKLHRALCEDRDDPSREVVEIGDSDAWRGLTSWLVPLNAVEETEMQDRDLWDLTKSPLDGSKRGYAKEER
jgi:hypothetical protein